MRGKLRGARRGALAVGVVLLLGPMCAQATPMDGLRLPFVANEGQVDARVAFYAPTFAGTIFVTRRAELVYSLPAPTSGAPRGRSTTASRPGWTLTETLPGGRGRPTGQDPSTTGVSFFLGNDPAHPPPKASTYDQLSLGEVWPGITVSLRARRNTIEKVFTVAPRAPVARIRVRVSGVDALAVNAEGALIARTGLGPVTFTSPVAYQERDGVHHPVAVAYRLTGREYGFTVGAYDPALPLVIDPLLQSTYLGGGLDDQATALAIHPATGDVYVAGSSRSTNFPGTAGGAQPPNGGGTDAYVARLNSALTTLIQTTYLGGSGSDSAFALAIHPTTGDVYVAGTTRSFNFPQAPTPGAQTVYGGQGDAFVVRLNRTLNALLVSTYLGGSNVDEAWALAIHPTTGEVYVGGDTASSNFPGTVGGAQPAIGSAGVFDAFVARLPSTLTSITQATYMGGSGDDKVFALAIHPATGDVYATGNTLSPNFPGTSGGAQPAAFVGENAYVARLSSTLTSLTQATYLGDSGDDFALALAIHPATGDVYVAGQTTSTSLPGIAAGAQPMFGGVIDAFVARLPSTLTSLTQATYLGGSGVDSAFALAIHPTTGDVYVAGMTDSTNFPGTSGAAQPVFAGNFVARLTSALTSLGQATYVGGFDTAYALAIHPTTGDVYVAGLTSSTSFPGTGGEAQPASGGGFDAFVARLTSSLALVDPLSLSVLTNRPTIAAGQTLRLIAGLINPGLPGAAADLYLGVLVPDGTIIFLTNPGTATGSLTDLASFKPLATGVSLTTAFSAAAPNFFSYPWIGTEPHGQYVFFFLAMKAGSLTSEAILGLAQTSFSFP